METGKEKYILGFNHSYLLKVYRPKLIEKILNTTSENDYIQGLKDGNHSYEQQKAKSRFQQLKSIKKSKNRDLGLER